MASLAEIRARLQAAESKNSGQTGGDNQIYPHWNIEEGANVVLRLLPDGDKQNTFFWAERAMIKLPFSGVKGESDSKQVTVQVPCVEMWNEACPILAEVRAWFKDKSLEDMGRKYWKKRSYIMQGFVRENPLADDKTPENPIRRFIMGPQIFQTIKSALMDPELEELPTDYERGLDFRITKTSKGGYADYSTSKWARKESALTDEEKQIVQSMGLFNLSDFLPKKPTDVELKVLKEMFEASVDGKPYDPERWSSYYRPAGVAAPSGAVAEFTTAKLTANGHGDVHEVKAEAKAAASSFDNDDAPVSDPVVQSRPVSSNAQDILAMIRSRQQKT